VSDAPGALDGLRVVVFEARRADELARMLERHGAAVIGAPALRETPLAANPEALDLARRLAAGEVALVILLTGVGTRALAAAVADVHPDFLRHLAATPIVARGPKPLAALRELGIVGARPVPPPYTWREALATVDGLALPAGALVAVQQYGAPPAGLEAALATRGLRVRSVPVYRWSLPHDVGPLRTGVARLAAGDADVAVFTSAVQVEHAFRVAEDADGLRAGLARVVVVSIGPVTSEALDAHGIAPDLEADPPKLGPLVALLAKDARTVLATKR
jgi:uroporphyrinogen-III synthase